MRYFIGDIPSDPLRVTPTRDGEPVDLSSAIAVITVDGTALDTTIEDGEVVGEWPATPVFTEEGLYPVTILVITDTSQETFEILPIAVEDPESGWQTTVSASGDWANVLSDVQLYELLSIARYQVEEYAPALAEDAKPPIRYRQAQVMQARNILNAAKTDPQTSDDGSMFVLRPYPMDSFIKGLLRPKKAVPVIG